MFFGTPHRETSAASWQDLLAAIGQAALHKTENHVDLWNINYGDLAEVSSSFLAISSRFKIINFYEELSHPRVGNLVSSHLDVIEIRRLTGLGCKPTLCCSSAAQRGNGYDDQFRPYLDVQIRLP